MSGLLVYHFLYDMTGAWLFLLGCQVLLIVFLDVGKLGDDEEMPSAALEMTDEAGAGKDGELVCDELLYL